MAEIPMTVRMVRAATTANFLEWNIREILVPPR
jgi:hypothetical protein